MPQLSRLLGVAAIGVGSAAGVYLGLVTGALSPDLRVGRRTRQLGPYAVDIDAPRELVYDVIAQPYLGRPTRALADKVHVLERGADMVLAAHFTPVHRRLTAQTVETVRFTRPERVDFRLVRGPVPHVVETFSLTEQESRTHLEYEGEMGDDLWALGEWWMSLVARRWEQVVGDSFDTIKAEAEHRTIRARAHLRLHDPSTVTVTKPR